MNKIVGFFKQYAAFVIMFVVAGVLAFIGIQIWSSGSLQVQAYERAISDTDNAIKNFNVQQYNVTKDIQHIDFGLDTNRWQNIDDKLALKFFQPAFTFKDSSEYIEHRNAYVTALGADDYFVTDFMPEYTPQWTYMTVGSNKEPDDGTHMSSKMDSFKTYVSNIDEDTGTYSYVGIVTCITSIPYDSYKGSLKSTNSFNNDRNEIILLYDITSDGQIKNISIFMSYMTRN